MSRISDTLAEQISYKLTEKTKKAVDLLHEEYRELATSIYESQIPEEVTVCFKKYPDWIRTKNHVTLDGCGFNREWLYTTRPVITNTENNEAHTKMSAAIGDRLSKAKAKWDKARISYNVLKRETKQALLALRTFNNIRKELPQAAQYLPPPISNALVVNFDSLKKQLDKQPEIKTSLINQFK